MGHINVYKRFVDPQGNICTESVKIKDRFRFFQVYLSAVVVAVISSPLSTGNKDSLSNVIPLLDILDF